MPLRGLALYGEPFLNKGSAFTAEERAEFDLDGVLPSAQNTMAQQVKRIHNMLDARTDPLDKYLELAALQDRNEHLFYRVLSDYIEEFLPVVYTPDRVWPPSATATCSGGSVEFSSPRSIVAGSRRCCGKGRSSAT